MYQDALDASFKATLTKHAAELEKKAFISAQLGRALKLGAGHMMAGAGLGALTGAAAAGEGNRLSGALGGAALGTVGGYGVSRMARAGALGQVRAVRNAGAAMKNVTTDPLAAAKALQNIR